MEEVFWIRLLNEGISLLFLIAVGGILYKGVKKNHLLLSEREETFRRYLLFREDLKVRMRLYGEDEKTYRELLRNLSEGWKNFKRNYDQSLETLLKNVSKTHRLLQFLTLALILNSLRLLLESYYFFGIHSRLLHLLMRELSNYVIVILGFFLLKEQSYRFFSMKGEMDKMDREILFYSNHITEIGEKKALYDEFSPLEKGEGYGKKD